MNKTTNTTDQSHRAPTIAPSAERLSVAALLRISHLLRGVFPQPIENVLLRLRVRMLMRSFNSFSEIVQSTEDASASEFVSIVVPVHDVPTVTRRCLNSLEKYAPKAEIVVVDDGSKLAETLNMLRDFTIRNGWQLVQHEKPLGHSVACGAGATLTTRPYLCLLNSDTVVTPLVLAAAEASV